MKRLRRGAYVLMALLVIAVGSVYAYDGLYGLNLVLRHGAAFWTTVTPDDGRLSPAMRLALSRAPVSEVPGPFSWRTLAPGFEVSEMPVMVDGAEVDRIYLSRIDPGRYRFVARTAPAGDQYSTDWLRNLHAALVINGSYYGRRGVPATPVLAGGDLQGPEDYKGGGGILTVSPDSAMLRQVVDDDWRRALAESSDGIVSHPLLVGGAPGAKPITPSRWLANRSFIGQDMGGRVLGTTKDAFFSLSRLAMFLRSAPLDLKIAMNLDGGPVACQAISLGDFRRDVCGRYELRETDGTFELFTLLYGRPVLPIALAAIPRDGIEK